jgi:hypothetical protein
MAKKIFILTISGFMILALSACIPGIFVPTQNNGMIATIAMQTAVVQITKSALETLIAKSTVSVLPTALPEATNANPQATSTTAPSRTPNSPTSTPTRVPFTRTPTAIPFTRTPTAIPVPCDWAQYVKDVTIPDGTDLNSQQSFTKTWRIRNIGSCTWSGEYSLVFSSGNAMGGPASKDINATVKPGESIDISVNLVAPSAGGSYAGYWKLRNTRGSDFGIGSDADTSFWVKIDVIARTATPNPNYVVDFVSSYCSAVWKSSESSLTCPGTGNDFDNGSISIITQPKLEGGNTDNEPALLTIPSDGTGGMISGKYGAYKVKSGDHFKAVIGCLDSSPNCDVMFQLNYIADNGSIQNLKTWTQTYDNSILKVDIDLSTLVDKSVQFILVVQNNGDSADDRAFWLAPRIVH